MRTIKFRGICFEDGSWVYGNYVGKNQHVRSCIDGHVTHVEHYDYIVNQDEIGPTNILIAASEIKSATTISV